MNTRDKELHRIVTTTLVYKPNPLRHGASEASLTYLITKRALHKKVMPGKRTIPGGGFSMDDYINTPSSTVGDYDFIDGIANEIREINKILKERNLG
ncbi:MAG: hypothetical protein AAB586_01110 [Patescibacteria group bacterium]